MCEDPQFFCDGHLKKNGQATQLPLTLMNDGLLKFYELFTIYFPLLLYLLSQENLLEFILLLKLNETQSGKISF